MPQEDTEQAPSSKDTSSDDTKKPKKTTEPPDGYVCNLCKITGHWIQQCPTRKQHNKRKRKTTTTHQPGVEPSPKDIERAKKMQAIPSPPCDCGETSRLKKVKRSHVTEHSRAVGSWFFFCAKKKDDATKCNFAKPVEEVQRDKKEKVQGSWYAKKRKQQVE
ncbi:expressed unknown protein [Seminavis robusta]|uniref:Zinc knuckle CX2CX3GHX4C domain-containing protein n=1 Tax=Seminavis robusta TaxID=568900 RepID=A0A9N8DAI9_9STRA|nr:expressed unknown protein [Seminavis robusta]|eukprot:Sro35_g022240.1 n/a (162) ;mRNA; f:46628-47113